jgi:hypothetical protein
MLKRLILAVTSLSIQQMPLQTQQPDTAIYLRRDTDQAGVDHTLMAVSNPSGITYSATLNPALQNYTSGQVFVVIPDVPPQPGATLNVNGLGPLTIQGTCSTPACLMIAVGQGSNPGGPPVALVAK